MSDINAIAKRFRMELAAREAEAAKRIISAYASIWHNVQEKYASLMKQMEEKNLRGQLTDTQQVNYLLQKKRLTTLTSQLHVLIAEFARYAGGEIVGYQRFAVQSAQRHAQELAEAAAPDEEAVRIRAQWNRLPHEALEHLVGNLSPDSPLTELLDQLGPDVSSAIKKAIVVGVGTGQNPRVIAAQLRKATGMGLNRALTISRTEALRSYRQAAIENYRANSDIIDGWVWVAALSARSCAMCIAMAGTFHSLDEDFGSHPNCRCTPVPSTRHDDVDDDEENAHHPQNGEAWLKAQPDAVQQRLLGKAGAQAWRDDEFVLKDVVGRKTSEKWGKQYYKRSLKETLQAAKERKEGL